MEGRYTTAQRTSGKAYKHISAIPPAMSKCNTCGKDYKTHPTREVMFNGKVIEVNDCQVKR